jgi:ribonuclease HI
MAVNVGLTRLIIEGDSKVIINLAAKIINGNDPENITPSWHLLGPLNSLKSLLRPSLTLITSHIRREANQVADRLANEGVASPLCDIFINTGQSQDTQLLLHCKELALQDILSPDGVTSGQIEKCWRACS